MEDKGKVGLLERLQAAARCTYLSDLSVIARSEGMSILAEMDRLGIGEYSLAEWNDAVSYITGLECSFGNVQEAWNFLVRYLS